MSYGKPIFFYDNLLKRYAVTVTSEASGYPKEHLYDDQPQSLWKAGAASADQIITIDAGSAVSVDIFCLGPAHNLASINAGIKLQYSATGAWAGEEVDAFASFTPGVDNSYQYRLFGPISARYWRVYLTISSGTPQIGEVAFGKRFTLPEYFSGDFDPDERHIEGTTNTSDGGQREDIVRYRRNVFPCRIDDIQVNTQAETDILAWRNAVEDGTPFWFLFDRSGSGTYEVYFVSLAERVHKAPVSSLGYRNFRFTLQEEL